MENSTIFTLHEFMKTIAIIAEIAPYLEDDPSLRDGLSKLQPYIESYRRWKKRKFKKQEAVDKGDKMAEGSKGLVADIEHVGAQESMNELDPRVAKYIENKQLHEWLIEYYHKHKSHWYGHLEGIKKEFMMADSSEEQMALIQREGPEVFVEYLSPENREKIRHIAEDDMENHLVILTCLLHTQWFYESLEEAYERRWDVYESPPIKGTLEHFHGFIEYFKDMWTANPRAPVLLIGPYSSKRNDPSSIWCEVHKRRHPNDWEHGIIKATEVPGGCIKLIMKRWDFPDEALFWKQMEVIRGEMPEWNLTATKSMPYEAGPSEGPWLLVPDYEWYRKVLKMYYNGYTWRQIKACEGESVPAIQTMRNEVSGLRKICKFPLARDYRKSLSLGTNL